MSNFPCKFDVEKWNVEEVAAYIQQMQVGDCQQAFLKRGIDGHSFLSLTEASLVSWSSDLPIKSRKKIAKLVKDINNQPALSSKLRGVTGMNSSALSTNMMLRPSVPSTLTPRRHPSDDSDDGFSDSDSDDEDHVIPNLGPPALSSHPPPRHVPPPPSTTSLPPPRPVPHPPSTSTSTLAPPSRGVSSLLHCRCLFPLALQVSLPSCIASVSSLLHCRCLFPLALQVSLPSCIAGVASLLDCRCRFPLGLQVSLPSWIAAVWVCPAVWVCLAVGCAQLWGVPSCGVCPAVGCAQLWGVPSCGVCPAVGCAQLWDMDEDGYLIAIPSPAASMESSPAKTLDLLLPKLQVELNVYEPVEETVGQRDGVAFSPGENGPPLPPRNTVHSQWNVVCCLCHGQWDVLCLIVL
ncbi:Sterile alpha motif domain [Trinorchestia longiramus]|nr:Sterile alpha motif domain [Trinorchestia longiramus]